MPTLPSLDSLVVVEKKVALPDISSRLNVAIFVARQVLYERIELFLPILLYGRLLSDFDRVALNFTAPCVHCHRVARLFGRWFGFEFESCRDGS